MPARTFVQVFPLRYWLHAIYGFPGMNQKIHCMDCGAGLNPVAVAPAGDIYPCPIFAAETEPEQRALGNVSSDVLPARVAGFHERIGSGPADCPS